MENVMLRDVSAEDLVIFYEQQLDADANRMAAFTVKEPADRAAFDERWERVLNDDTMMKKTVLYNGEVAGYVASFEMFGEQTVGYWIGRKYWGKGIATLGLSQFLVDCQQRRPLYARAAKDNKPSIRVLEKCGFNIIGEDKGFSEARAVEVEEFILKLE
ncbi:GNAT family N-acetyltransferase [Paenibacillus sp. GCM10027627]|uniref:GNAT family N-acetyltransferase n=1 Tax=unclassified Paenibacillus TaxID=185978 RepID=UPI00363BB14B